MAFYARNDHLGLPIPYECTNIDHSYEPDFPVRLASGVTAIVEVKGFADDRDKARHTAAKRWVTALNNWGELRKWTFRVCRNPLLDREMGHLSRERPLTQAVLELSQDGPSRQLHEL
jgi:type III restriction enzyme